MEEVVKKLADVFDIAKKLEYPSSVGCDVRAIITIELDFVGELEGVKVHVDEDFFNEYTKGKSVDNDSREDMSYPYQKSIVENGVTIFCLTNKGEKE